MCCCGSTPRADWIRCLIILALVLVLSTPVSVSLPYLPTFDVVHVRFNTTVKLRQGLGSTDIQGLRFGIWSACFYNSSHALTCLKSGCGYTIHVSTTVRNQTITATVPSSYTNALIIHPVATAVVLIVFLTGLTTHRMIMLALGYLAFLLSFTACLIHISLSSNLVRDPRFGGTVAGGIGMWMTFLTSLLIMFSTCTPRPSPPRRSVVPLRNIEMDPPTPGVPLNIVGLQGV